MARLLPVGRVHGQRGRRGEMTVRVALGDARRWSGVREVWLRRGEQSAQCFTVERERAYRDRWVLKLSGLDDATEAANWRGAFVEVAADQAPPLAPGEYRHMDLVGMSVRCGALVVGTVRDVQPTAGADLLVVETEDGQETLVPFHRDIVVEVDEGKRTLEIEPPEGLLELNRNTD